jgi:hypothetical protein
VGASLARRIRASPDPYLRAPALIGAGLRGVTSLACEEINIIVSEEIVGLRSPVRHRRRVPQPGP